MRRFFCFALFCLIVSAQSPASAQHNHAGASKYAGQEQRAIKSLSPDDIAELRRGGGWGLAKAAELNGVPGPVHLLEMKDKIDLSPEQVKKIEALFQMMKRNAIAAGEKLIALEERLEKEFRSGRVTDQSLRNSLDQIAEARAALRFTHLSAHLRTGGIVSKEQIKRYNVLRGYAADPCSDVPAGHDAVMWRKHNGCK